MTVGARGAVTVGSRGVVTVGARGAVTVGACAAVFNCRYCDSRRKVLLAHVHEGYDKDW